MEQIHIILFYKFTEIHDPGEFANDHLRFCKKHNLLGKIIFAEEGINGSLSGSKKEIEKYKEFAANYEQFSDMTFKEEIGTFNPFKKLVVKSKDEIIRIDQDINLNKKGQHLSPKELIDLYNSGEDFIILDTRNNYESSVGKFKNAITPDIDSFREFPKALELLKDKKDKKIITYCTGGIRCEKATAYMMKEGFTNVFQLKDGIINFCQEYPNTLWEGKCFVFDQRLIAEVDPDSKIFSKCIVCNELCDRYQNCKNQICDELIILCEKCGEGLNGCCSDECCREYTSYLERKSRERQGYKVKKTG